MKLRYRNENYITPHRAGAFSGLNTFLKANTTAKRAIVSRWLESLPAYTRHYPVKRKFPRRRIVVPGPNYQLQADLIDMSALSRYNKGTRYVLTIIDSFSKFAHAYPLKNKGSEAIVNAFELLFKKIKQPPNVLLTDKGKEFFNSNFQRLLKEHKVKHVTSENEDIKASIVERFNKTLKTKIYRYLTHVGNKNYVTELPAILQNYNASYHRSIKMAPKNVNESNRLEVYHNLYEDDMDKQFTTKPKRYRFQVGDLVRISISKTTFERSFQPRWSKEIFIIHRRLPTRPRVYKIRDEAGEVIMGSFYEPELQRVRKHV